MGCREYVLVHRPDLLMIGGISQRGDIESIRAVMAQVRAERPETEILLMTGAFGRRTPGRTRTGPMTYLWKGTPTGLGSGDWRPRRRASSST